MIKLERLEKYNLFLDDSENKQKQENLINMLDKSELTNGLSLNEMKELIEKSTINPVQFEVLKKLSLEKNNKMLFDGLNEVEKEGKHPLNLMHKELKDEFLIDHNKKYALNLTSVKFSEPLPVFKLPTNLKERIGTFNNETTKSDKLKMK